MPGPVEQLTVRELEVLALLAAGMPNPRIAGELALTPDAVAALSCQVAVYGRFHPACTPSGDAPPRSAGS